MNFSPTPGSGTTTNFAPQFSAPQAGSGTTTNFAPQGSGTTTNFAPQFSAPPQPTTSTIFEQVPSGTLSPGATFGSGTRVTPQLPASGTQSPAVSPLQNVSPFVSQRPFLDRFNKAQTNNYQASALREVDDKAPARFNIEDKTASSPVRKEWRYSPVRTASFSKPTTTRAQMAPISRRTRSNDLNGWKEVN